MEAVLFRVSAVPWKPKKLQFEKSYGEITLLMWVYFFGWIKIRYLSSNAFASWTKFWSSSRSSGVLEKSSLYNRSCAIRLFSCDWIATRASSLRLLIAIVNSSIFARSTKSTLSIHHRVPGVICLASFSMLLDTPQASTDRVRGFQCQVQYY